MTDQIKTGGGAVSRFKIAVKEDVAAYNKPDGVDGSELIRTYDVGLVCVPGSGWYLKSNCQCTRLMPLTSVMAKISNSIVDVYCAECGRELRNNEDAIQTPGLCIDCRQAIEIDDLVNEPDREAVSAE